MKLKKKMKCFLASQGVKKALQKEILNNIYEFAYTDNIEEADVFLAPVELDKYKHPDDRLLKKAESLGLLVRTFNEELLSLNAELEDPLLINQEKEIEKSDVIQDDLYDMDLFI
ncbi:MAG: hypothetical protein SOR72_04400 [Hornefia sp.]|nr:hypothetical protein [Hornefia sp.]